MPTTLSISGGYANFLETLEDRLDQDAPPSFPEGLLDRIDNSIDPQRRHRDADAKQGRLRRARQPVAFATSN